MPDDDLLVFRPDGTMLAVYDDDLPDLGPRVVPRASHVEPDPAGGWTVTLTDIPENGRHAGRVIASHVPRRAEALRLEAEFIQRECLI